jgi:aminoglycoside 2'-N-acetyltransferase I
MQAMQIVLSEIVGGNDGWGQAQELLAQVWPPHLRAELPWRDVHWAHADRRLLLWSEPRRLACHVGLFERTGSWNGAGIRLAGVGGVATRPEFRRQGFASAAMRQAAQELSAVGTADCGLLFCEPQTVAFYQKLGWHSFNGKVFAQQPQGRIAFALLQPLVLDLKLAVRSGTLDVCGLPW